MALQQAEQSAIEQQTAAKAEAWQAKYLEQRTKLHQEAQAIQAELAALAAETGDTYNRYKLELQSLVQSLYILDVTVQKHLASQTLEDGAVNHQIAEHTQQPSATNDKLAANFETIAGKTRKRKKSHIRGSGLRWEGHTAYKKGLAEKSKFDRKWVTEQIVEGKTDYEEMDENGEFYVPETFININENALDALQDLRDRIKTERVEKRFATTSILGDGDKIEGHQIDFIHKKGKILVTFKLTAAMDEIVQTQILPSLQGVRNGQIQFQSHDARTAYDLVSCKEFSVDPKTNVSVSIGRNVEYREQPNYNKPIIKDGVCVDYEQESVEVLVDKLPTLKGFVQIAVSTNDTEEQIIWRIEKAFAKLHIDQALEEPDETAELAYKKARLMWQQRLKTEEEYAEYAAAFLEQYGVDVTENLERQEVFPGYFTIVDKGALERYQHNGQLYLYHKLWDYNMLPSILRTGLLSSLERYKNGVIVQGWSTIRDFHYGSADNVFIRCAPSVIADNDLHLESGTCILDPQILERTDWYAYDHDEYGKIDPRIFDERMSPSAFFDHLRTNFTKSNEIMVRRGIPPEAILAVHVDRYEKANYIAMLEQAGITEVNGIPVKDFVISADNFGELRNALDTLGVQKRVDMPGEMRLREEKKEALKKEYFQIIIDKLNAADVQNADYFIIYYENNLGPLSQEAQAEIQELKAKQGEIKQKLVEEEKAELIKLIKMDIEYEAYENFEKHCESYVKQYGDLPTEFQAQIAPFQEKCAEYLKKKKEESRQAIIANIYDSMRGDGNLQYWLNCYKSHFGDMPETDAVALKAEALKAMEQAINEGRNSLFSGIKFFITSFLGSFEFDEQALLQKAYEKFEETKKSKERIDKVWGKYRTMNAMLQYMGSGYSSMVDQYLTGYETSYGALPDDLQKVVAEYFQGSNDESHAPDFEKHLAIVRRRILIDGMTDAKKLDSVEMYDELTSSFKYHFGEIPADVVATLDAITPTTNPEALAAYDKTNALETATFEDAELFRYQLLRIIQILQQTDPQQNEQCEVWDNLFYQVFGEGVDTFDIEADGYEDHPALAVDLETLKQKVKEQVLQEIEKSESHMWISHAEELKSAFEAAYGQSYEVAKQESIPETIS